MMGFVTAAADRLLGWIAPKATAEACTPRTYNKNCGCKRYNGYDYIYYAVCNLDYYCHETCGSCSHRTSVEC